MTLNDIDCTFKITNTKYQLWNCANVHRRTCIPVSHFKHCEPTSWFRETNTYSTICILPP